ncbi:MAG: transpeptidase family protein [Saprospiraceae bacterium]|nr:transpeptidase family protein [Saprospiraceae bacterium]
MDKKKELLWRAYLVMFFFVVATVVILFKIFKISFVEREKWRQKGEVNVQWRVVDADRGNIYAEDGYFLSTSLQFFEVRMDMSIIRQSDFNNGVDSLALFLSTFDPNFIRQKTKAEWKKELTSARKRGNKYFFIGKALDIEAFNKLKKAPILRLGKIRGGMVSSRYGKRLKPYKELASRTIGVDRENADRIGLEGYFDKFLKGDTDQRLMKRLSPAEDIWVPVYDPSENEIKRGDDIYTTINIDMQDIVHHELLETVQKFHAEGGVAILMETGTGAIKAMSNLTKGEDSTYFEMYNQAAGRLSEPGTTLKLATILALLEDGVKNPDTLVYLNYGQKNFSDRTMHDSEKHGRQYATMAEAFEISSNVGMATLANDVYNSREGRKQWVKRLRQFGLNEPTGIDITGEAIPEIKDPVKDKAKWYGTTIPWMAHGYELMMTPLQILNFYNAVANNGKMMKPYLVSEIKKGDEMKKKFEPTVLKAQIAKPENIVKAKKMLEGVILKGTGKSLQSEFVSMAGKTGTAKTNYANVGEHGRYNASFCGYFPAEHPMYTMIVVVYDPRGGVYYGGYVAGPVFKKVAEKVYALKTKQVKTLNDSMATASALPGSANGYTSDFNSIFEYLDMKSDKNGNADWSKVIPSSSVMSLNEKKIKNTIIPDVVGMGARDAMFVLENMGLKVQLEGVGKVFRQSIPAGASNHKQRIIIYLN